MDPELTGIPGTAKGMGLRVSRRTRIMGVTGLGVGLPRPVEGEGAEQRVLVEIPDCCPECGSVGVSCAAEAGMIGQPRRISCFLCGWDAFLVLPPLAPVVNAIEIEKGFTLGQRQIVRVDGTAVRAARPRRIDRRKRPTRMPEPPVGFRRNGGVQIFP